MCSERDAESKAMKALKARQDVANNRRSKLKGEKLKVNIKVQDYEVTK